MSSIGSKLRRAGVAAALACGTFVGLPSAPAFAIKEVGCQGRTDLLKVAVFQSDGSHVDSCYVESGPVAVNLAGARISVSAGRNDKVTINYEYGGRYETASIRAGAFAYLESCRIYELRIW